MIEMRTTSQKYPLRSRICAATLLPHCAVSKKYAPLPRCHRDSIDYVVPLENFLFPKIREYALYGLYRLLRRIFMLDKMDHDDKSIKFAAEFEMQNK